MSDASLPANVARNPYLAKNKRLAANGQSLWHIGGF
jgi:hypothetical protein